LREQKPQSGFCFAVFVLLRKKLMESLQPASMPARFAVFIFVYYYMYKELPEDKYRIK
jgi:hypothetical protein